MVWRRRAPAAAPAGRSPSLAHARSSSPKAMYDATGADGKRAYTVAQIAAEFGITRPTVYRHLAKVQRTQASPAT